VTFVVDIDNTLLKSSSADYSDPRVFTKEVALVNDAFAAGHTIILWTGRNWDKYDLTVEQLRAAGVCYNELVMGKPQGVYVDADAKTSMEDLA
jgi:hydroxymethylpyrimidine pyrophosphatase-like HAD family hydrolase